MFLASYRQLVVRVVLPAIILITVVTAVESRGQQRESHSRLKNTRGEPSAYVSYKGSPRSVIAGILNGSSSATPATVNLTTEGTTDWTHWGLNLPNDFVHKAGVTQQISNCTIVGSASLIQCRDNPSGYGWSNGTP